MRSFFSSLIPYARLGLARKGLRSYAVAESNVVFVDNQFPNFIEQISPFFESGLFDREDTVLVFKYYRKSYGRVQQLARQYGIKTYCYLRFDQIPNVTGKRVYYPYNAQTNCRLMLNREAEHIFITHGESNKKASINRMVRMYDKIYASGQISIDRYLEWGVLSPYDVAQGKIEVLGHCYTKSILNHVHAKGGRPCIAYLPTWEGGNELENYSSIISAGTASTLIELAQKTQVEAIVIRPHPNLGSRDNKYKMALNKLIEKLRVQGLVVNLDAPYFGSILPSTLRYEVKLGVCDISASEFMLAAKKIPTVVFVKKEKQMYATKKYHNLKSKLIVDVGQPAAVSLELLDNDYLSDHAEQIYSYAFGRIEDGNE